MKLTKPKNINVIFNNGMRGKILNKTDTRPNADVEANKSLWKIREHQDIPILRDIKKIFL